MKTTGQILLSFSTAKYLNWLCESHHGDKYTSPKTRGGSAQACALVGQSLIYFLMNLSNTASGA